MTTHSYPTPAIAGDYLRAGAGLCLAGLPLVIAETAAAVTALLVGLGVIFALHGARTVSRHVARIELSDDGIRSRGLSEVQIRWRDLRALQLSHYSTRRDHSGGWMQLLLISDKKRVRIDSHLQNFAMLAARAVVAAQENRIPLDPATVSNLDALGVSPITAWPCAGSVCR